ncbi:mRNA cleavage and polyadenylation factor subunit [Xylographa pallens]|nr:mRNA cleavage and polyadenylation factor subunit [Xylographa pallens]
MPNDSSDYDDALLARLNALKKSNVSFGSKQISSTETSSGVNSALNIGQDGLINRFRSIGGVAEPQLHAGPGSEQDEDDGKTVEDLLAEIGPDGQWTQNTEEPNEMQKLLNEARQVLSRIEGQPSIRGSEELSQSFKKSGPDTQLPSPGAPAPTAEAATEAPPTQTEDEEAAAYLQQILDELQLEEHDETTKGPSHDNEDGISGHSSPQNLYAAGQGLSGLNMPSVPTSIPLILHQPTDDNSLPTFDLPSAPTTAPQRKSTIQSVKTKLPQYSDQDIETCSSSKMQCFTQLTPPTAVTHTISLPFLSASANNLVVAKTSLLQIYSFKTVVSNAVEQDAGIPNGHERRTSGVKGPGRDRVQTTKLVLIAQYDLSGTIIGLGRVKTLRSTSGGEALLVALKDAKLSLIEWDPERYSISTISVHFYERDDLQVAPWAQDNAQCVNQLTTDPSSRCAALKFGARHVAILPFHQAGDELVMDDFDGGVSDDQSRPTNSSHKQANGDSHHLTPYRGSFVLSLLALDPGLMHVVHLGFLHEYREPTFGVLSSRLAASSALYDRRNVLSYAVYTLDLEQRASTTLLSVTNLPYDIHTILPLSMPIGGALLIGCNELIHVDQAGKANGIAVNDFARKNASFPLPSQPDLALRLEGCAIEDLGNSNGDMLIILRSGELAILRFRIDGRSVSGLSIRLIQEQSGGHLLSSAASCTTGVGRGRIFIGCEENNSVVIGWMSRSMKLKRQRSVTEANDRADAMLLDPEDDEEEEAEDEDDLYFNDKADGHLSAQPTSSPTDTEIDEYSFRIHDSLLNLAPLGNLKVLEAQSFILTDPSSQEDVPNKLELVASTGHGKAGKLTKLRMGISPQVQRRFDLGNVQATWSVAVKNLATKSSQPIDDYDSVIITSVVTDAGEEQSCAYTLRTDPPTELLESDFDSSAGATIALGTLSGGTRIVQVLKNEIRAYDDDLSLAQIFPISEDPTPEDPRIVAASFAEPYVLLLRDDSNAMLLKADDAGELEEVEQGNTFSSTAWLSISLFDDSNDVFRLAGEEEEADDEGSSVLMFLLNVNGGLQVYKASDLSHSVYSANGLSFLPPFLSEDFTIRRSSAREPLVEILVAELGDAVTKSPYLILRSGNDDVTIYHPYQSALEGVSTSSLRFAKIPVLGLSNTITSNVLDGQNYSVQKLRAIQDVGGYSTVFRAGVSPCLVLKIASAAMQIIPINSASMKSFASFHTADCRRGYLSVDDMGAISAALLPSHADFSTGWLVETLLRGKNITAFDYHAVTDRYVLGVGENAEYKLPDDELHPEWIHEDINFLPQIEQGLVQIFTPSSGTITDTYALDSGEVVMCIRTMSLETSEITHVRRSLIVVGTSFVLGEDLGAKGRIYVFDIIEVVPEPDFPETSRKLKLIAKEEVKGAVTSISEVGTEGFLLVAQGQKCMVRGLKEDGTLLPVAFIDAQCYITVAKELRGSGLCIMADAIKGVWLTGYLEDPYQLRLFGKSAQHLEVVAAEFLPHGKDLYIVVGDAEGEMHIFQFDPHNPKSLTGQRLLHLSNIDTGAYPTTMTLLAGHPASDPLADGRATSVSSDDTPASLHQILLTSQTGAVSLLSSLTPSAYRTLAAMQAYLTNTLPHPLGLNPRAYRSAEADNTVGGRAVLDGDVLKRWKELGSWKRAEGMARAGLDAEWEFEVLLEGVWL